MLALNLDSLNQEILSYFQSFFKDNHVNTETRLSDLGFESIDYIELATVLFAKTGAWLDISKLSNDIKISSISSCMLYPEPGELLHKQRVRLDMLQRYAYTYEIEHQPKKFTSHIIHYLCLKENIDIAKLEYAIVETLNNHFILNSKLIRIIDDYFFEEIPPPTDFTFKGSMLFPSRDLAKLKISIQSERLVNIFLQRKKKNYYLIISFHHIAVDGWSHKIIQEEIFRRYAGLYKIKQKQASEDIPALNKIYSASINEQSNPEELRALLEPINPRRYNQLDHLFKGKLEANYSCFVITKEEMDIYARMNNISDFSYSVIIMFLFYQMMHQASKTSKLIIHSSLSNRYLPISGIKELVANTSLSLPLFLDNQNSESRQFAATISKILKIYFKHMSYGAVTRILLENDTLLNTYISPFHQPYYLIISYINNLSKMIHGTDSILGNYVHLNQSKTHLPTERVKQVSFYAYNMGNQFLIQIHSQILKGLHLGMIDQFFEINFPKHQ